VRVEENESSGGLQTLWRACKRSTLMGKYEESSEGRQTSASEEATTYLHPRRTIMYPLVEKKQLKYTLEDEA